MSAQTIALFAAIIVYGLAGSPTPDNPGWPEIIIGVLLLASTGMAALTRLQNFRREEGAFFTRLHLLFIYGLILPVLTGILNGNALSLILRDLLAFSFLCLPLFAARGIAKSDRAITILPWLLAFVGIAFSIRTLLPAFNIWVARDKLLYLSNSPLVLFTALFFVGGLWKLYTHLSVKGFALSVPLIVGIATISAAMLLDIQRATLAAIALSVVVMAGVTLIKTPRRVIVPAALFILMIFAILPWLSDAANAVYRKTSEVGFNMRQ